MTQPSITQQTSRPCQQTRRRCDVVVIASRWAEKPLTSTNAHTRKCHNRRSKPLPLKLSGWGAFLTPGGSRQDFFRTTDSNAHPQTGKSGSKAS